VRFVRRFSSPTTNAPATANPHRSLMAHNPHLSTAALAASMRAQRRMARKMLRHHIAVFGAHIFKHIAQRAG
jgi:hypothetical protein